MQGWSTTTAVAAAAAAAGGMQLSSSDPGLQAAAAPRCSSIERSGSGQGLSSLQVSSSQQAHMLRVSVPPHHSSQQQLSSLSPVGSPRHSGAGGSCTSSLKPAAPAAAAGTAASLSSTAVAASSVLRHRSTATGHAEQPPHQQPHSQQAHQHADRGSSTQLLGVEMVAQAPPLVRHHSVSSSSPEGPHSRSDSEASLHGDSSTQLIRVGACRSDDYVD